MTSPLHGFPTGNMDTAPRTGLLGGKTQIELGEGRRGDSEADEDKEYHNRRGRRGRQ